MCRLEQLCANETFVYRNLLVNAVQRQPNRIKLEPIAKYMIDDERCNSAVFRNETNKAETLKIIEEYNKKLLTIYSSAYVEGEAFKNIIWERNEINKLVDRIFGVIRNLDESKNSCVDQVLEKLYEGINLVRILVPFYHHEFQQKDYADISPNKERMLESFNLNLMFADEEKGDQIFAFSGIPKEQVGITYKL